MFLRQSEVSDLSVPVLVNENVLRLQVSIYDVILVKFLDSQNKLGDIKLSDFFVEMSSSLQMEEQFTSRAELKHEIKFFWVLKSIFQLNDERMFDIL